MVLSNYPALKRDEVALAVIETVIPALAVAIDEAAQDVAANLFGDEATTFDIERIANDVLFALGDYLDLSPVPRRGVTDLLRVHQLQNTAYAEDYFGVKADEETPCEFSLTETEQALVESPVWQNSAERDADPTQNSAQGLSESDKPHAPYAPAIVSTPTEPAPRVVVDNRPGTRTLDDIRREVSGITRRPVTPIHFMPYDERKEARQTAIERARLEQQRRDDEAQEAKLKQQSRRDAREERDLKPGGQMPLKLEKPDTPLPRQYKKKCANPRCSKKFVPKSRAHIYCSEACKSNTWHREYRKQQRAQKNK